MVQADPVAQSSTEEMVMQEETVVLQPTAGMQGTVEQDTTEVPLHSLRCWDSHTPPYPMVEMVVTVEQVEPEVKVVVGPMAAQEVMALRAHVQEVDRPATVGAAATEVTVVSAAEVEWVATAVMVGMAAQ
jgi:hypothetical protein